jgi:hypothetical protein
MKNFELSTGMKISFQILKRLKKDKRLKNIPVMVSTFVNCRESGLSFLVQNKKDEWFTFCTYEHRNSDNIVINGKEGFLTIFNRAELPYTTENKWEYLGGAQCDDFDGAENQLARLIIAWSKSNKKLKH